MGQTTAETSSTPEHESAPSAGPAAPSDTPTAVEEDQTPSSATSTTPEEIVGPPKPKKLTVILGKLDENQEILSYQVETMAKSIDSFFSEDKMFEEATNSYVRIRLDTVVEQYSKIGFAGDLRLKLDLPRTKRKLKLLIESDPQRDLKDDLQDLPRDVVQEKDYFLSLERQLNESGRWDIRPSLGIKARIPPDPFARLRAIRYVDLDEWLLRISGNLIWFDSKGFGAESAFDFDRVLSKKLLLRFTTLYGWEEEDMFRHAGQVVSLFQSLDRRQSIVYQIGMDATDENSWLATDYYTRLRYRKDIHNNWLFAEISPQWTFLKENNFHPDRTLTLRLEMVFGRGGRED